MGGCAARVPRSRWTLVHAECHDVQNEISGEFEPSGDPFAEPGGEMNSPLSASPPESTDLEGLSVESVADKMSALLDELLVPKNLYACTKNKNLMQGS